MNKWEKNKNIMNTLFNYQHMCTFSDTVVICKVKKQQMGDCGGGGNRVLMNKKIHKTFEGMYLSV
jgi:hypothetical protein